MTMSGARQERGSQILELAAVLPLLLFLTLAAIEGGSMLRVHELLNNAAREGARIAVNPTFGTAANRNSMVQQTVTDYLNRNNIIPSGSFTLGQCSSWSAGSDVAVSSGPGDTFQIPPPVTPSANVTMQMTRVTVTCPYQFYFLPRLSFFGRSPLAVNLQGSTLLLDMY
jgi:Flp pilus assembly protein TadG